MVVLGNRKELCTDGKRILLRGLRRTDVNRKNKMGCCIDGKRILLRDRWWL
jgi:hypothetical protein